jgi:Tol biopolymer transport system component
MDGVRVSPGVRPSAPMRATKLKMLIAAGVAIAAVSADSALAESAGRIAYVQQTSEGVYALHSVRPDGTRLRKLVRPARGYRRPTLPRYSPDGRRLAFANFAGREGRPGPLFVATATGKDVREVPFRHRTGVRRPFPTGLSWAPDSRRVVMAEARSSDDHRMHIIRVDGPERHRSIGPGQAPVWSPDGRWIAFWHDGGVWSLRPEDPSGSRRLLVRADEVAGLTFTPDSKRVLFTRQSSSTLDWSVVPVGGGESRHIVSQPATADSFPCSPQYAPSGRRLAAMRIVRDDPESLGRRVFTTIEPDGTGERTEFDVAEAIHGDHACDFSWQPRG